MNFQTLVELPAGVPSVSHTDRILMMGSCFAASIGVKLSEAKFPVDVNPFGILYNPLSISEALREVMRHKVYTEADLFVHDGLWHSPMHHGSFSSPECGETLRNICYRLDAVAEGFASLTWIVVTFGTSVVYERQSDGRVVANCHRLPAAEFRRRRLGVGEITDGYADLITGVHRRNPAVRWIFTVSPIRYTGDGMHENQLSKSVLLLAVDALQRLFPGGLVTYFPAYEIMLDELRDYRFYADDLVHPSLLAVDCLWDSFSRTFFTAETRALLADIETLRKGLAHRPFHPGGSAYRRFVEQLMGRIDELCGKYPYLDFQKEKEQCRMRLER